MVPKKYIWRACGEDKREFLRNDVQQAVLASVWYTGGVWGAYFQYEHKKDFTEHKKDFGAGLAAAKQYVEANIEAWLQISQQERDAAAARRKAEREAADAKQAEYASLLEKLRIADTSLESLRELQSRYSKLEEFHRDHVEFYLAGAHPEEDAPTTPDHGFGSD